MQNRVFFPQAALDHWMIDGTIDLSGTELTILAEARRYDVAEAVHVLREVTGGADPNELLGRVKSKQYLQELGAELLESSMILGDQAYDVTPGWIGAPQGSFEAHAASEACKVAHAQREATRKPGAARLKEPTTDEELLLRSLLKSV